MPNASSNAVVLTVEEMIAKRARLLESTRMSEDELRERAVDYSLSDYEVAVLNEINGLDWLISGVKKAK